MVTPYKEITIQTKGVRNLRPSRVSRYIKNMGAVFVFPLQEKFLCAIRAPKILLCAVNYDSLLQIKFQKWRNIGVYSNSEKNRTR